MKCCNDMGTHCKALTEKNCCKCKFYKSEEQLKKDDEKTRERLRKIGWLK